MIDIELTFWVDPGHAWLEIPRATCEALGVTLTPYSYVSPDRSTYYAEEDLDASAVIKALETAGFLVTFREEYREKIFVRNLPRIGG